jgi:hypothetical protein
MLVGAMRFERYETVRCLWVKGIAKRRTDGFSELSGKATS